MASTADKPGAADFERQHDDRKPYREYWFGQFVPKAMPTWIHGILQGILIQLLRELDYHSGSEVKLKISADFEPVPDVIATSGKIEIPYPTRPVDVVIEILSPEDSFQRIHRKCRLYAEWGIPAVFVIDPEERAAWTWDRAAQSLARTAMLPLTNDRSLTLARIFEELDAEIA